MENCCVRFAAPREPSSYLGPRQFRRDMTAPYARLANAHR